MRPSPDTGNQSTERRRIAQQASRLVSAVRDEMGELLPLSDPRAVTQAAAALPVAGQPATVNVLNALFGFSQMDLVEVPAEGGYAASPFEVEDVSRPACVAVEGGEVIFVHATTGAPAVEGWESEGFRALWEKPGPTAGETHLLTLAPFLDAETLLRLLWAVRRRFLMAGK